MKKERIVWICITSILLILLLFNTYFTNLNSSELDNYQKLETVKQLINKNYYITPNEEKDLINNAAKGMIATLNDPYSIYYPRDELQQRMESLKGKFGGIGAWVGQRENYIIILKPINGYPAAKAGLKAMDKIISIDDKNVVGKNLNKDVIPLLKGDPGTEVKITVLREGATEPISYNITRAKVVVPSISSADVSKDIGYIKIHQFSEDTYKDFKETISNRMNDKKQKKFILDLRNNPGGYLDSVLNMLNLFFDKKLLVYTEGRNVSFNQKHFSNKSKLVPDDIELVLLINGASASASEIFAGVMKDYGRAKIIGQTSFGKGVVQQIFRLTDGSAVFLTTSQYFTPSGNVIHNEGITPNKIIEEFKLTEEDKIKISLLSQTDYIQNFTKKYGENYSESNLINLNEQLRKEHLDLPLTLLDRIVFTEVKKNDVDFLFDLQHDNQMKFAYEYLSNL